MNAIRSATVLAAALLSGLALAVGFGTVSAPSVPRAAGLASADPGLTALADRDVELDGKRERLFRGVEVADGLAAGLAAGTLSLGDATDAMEPLMHDRPGFVYTYTTHYRVPNLRLGTARYLIGKVERLLGSDPGRWAEVSARLEAEFAAMK